MKQPLFTLFNSIQSYLFPTLSHQLGEKLSVKEQKFVNVCCLAGLEDYSSEFRWRGIGRKPVSRLAVLKAFIAKAVYNISITRELLDLLRSCPSLRRLCGWESVSGIPSESTFSRLFSQFAESSLPQRIHENLIIKNYGHEAEGGGKLAGHCSTDSTAIEAREKAAKKPTAQKTENYPRGRPKKGEVREPKPPRKLELQMSRSLEENLTDLPKACDIGCKKNSKGYRQSWRGYKFHISCVDGDIPVAAVLTSASVHDSQVAIPLMQMTSERIDVCYDLMDAAYDAPEIHAVSDRLGRIPIIDSNKRRGEKCEFCPAEKERYKERSAVERVNSNLKDNYGCRNIRVKGADKIACHLMFGLLAVTATQIFRLLC